MNSLSVLGKYLDQPKLVKRISDGVPAILVIGGTVFTINEVRKAPKGEKRKTFIKNTAVLTGTIASAIAAPSIAKKLVKCHHHHHHHNIGEEIDEFLNTTAVSENTRKYLNEAKTKILGFSKIKTIFEELGQNKESKEFLDELIPNPENIDSNHIFKEDVKRLSILGLIPVLGGITGGIVGDKITEKDWKQRVPDKIKEGAYQYLANIFLCNIGAGAALFAMEKAKVQSKAWRALGMVGGIILTGIIFGSTMANLIGKKLIDPIFKHKHHDGQGPHKHRKIFDERKPEALDFGLHVDDVATVAVMSGLKWIEPALPILYSISGYRAGIGYRNNEKGQK